MQDAKAPVLGQIKNIKRRLVQGEEEEKVRLRGDKWHGDGLEAPGFAFHNKGMQLH